MEAACSDAADRQQQLRSLRRFPDDFAGRKQLASGLWARADAEGAKSQMERRNFGIADDVYAAGLLLAYLAFIPFCEPGSIDAPSLQRCTLSSNILLLTCAYLTLLIVGLQRCC